MRGMSGMIFSEKRKNNDKLHLTTGGAADKINGQNKEGWKHPPHPQLSEGVKMV